ncbi:cardiolipin synthase [Parahaliea aestuarii]|uniref:cardiolipin synthase n=1 Tax=Parahaliea aestuarii TaxID=1852021 RepID=UPI001FE670DF|nr:cardiolipin synthase [Parahaliea aestuarii]
MLFYLTAVFCAVDAIIRVRTAQGAIAWALSLLTIPYLALPCYLIFGRNKFAGYLEQRREIAHETRELLQRTHNALDDYLIGYSDELPLYNSLYNLSRTPATSGNRIELLVNGQATFKSILDGLETATDYILIEFYIIRDDNLGARFTRILSQKAQQGVRVHLLYDEIGSRNFHRTRMCKQLLKTGVEVAAFNTTQGRRNRFQLNFRNHRKIVVVDGKQAWVGGHNIGDEYLGLNKRRGFWRDTHARLEGPAVLGVELAFATDWRWATRKPLEIQHQLEPPRCGNSDVLVFASDPASTLEEAGLMFHQVIVEARYRIWIASPYFVPDRGIISALQLAALRGVDVRLIIPDEPDGPLVGLANWAFTRELLPAGVKLYRYQGGFMHQKVLLMDNKVAGIGTANFDNRSFRLNFEITLLVHDEHFCVEIEEMLEDDIAHSHRVTPEEIADKPLWFTFATGVARLFSPIL